MPIRWFVLTTAWRLKMQDHDKNNKSNNVRRTSGSDGQQAPRSNGQPRSSGASRSSGQPRRQAPSDGRAPKSDGQPRRQTPSDGSGSKSNGQPRRQAPSGNGRQGAGGQSSPAGQPRSNNGTRANSRQRPAEGSNQPKPRRQSSEAGQTRSSNGAQANNRPRKKPNNGAPHKTAKKKGKKIILFVAEIFLLLILLGALWAVNKTQKIQHIALNPAKVHINEDVKAEIEQGTSIMKGYRNIALFGVDSRDKQLDQNTRTDVIMVASINLDTKEVRLISVYRDTWLNMTNDKYSKANAAYAKGGAEQAIGMLNMNLDLDITDFITVGFDAVIDVVDAIGGVEIDVKEEEIAHLNSYQISMVGRVVGTNAKGEDMYEAIEGVEYTPVTHAGLQTLNGLQATAYCRIRYTSGGDGARTERQRRVLTLIAQKAMTMNPATLNKIVDAVFGEVATSLTMPEILELLADIASYKIGETAGFPFSDHVEMAGWVGKASVVVPIDLTRNVSLLHEFLFDESDYTPTDTVKQCSQKIASDTGISYNGE